MSTVTERPLITPPSLARSSMTVADAPADQQRDGRQLGRLVLEGALHRRHVRTVRGGDEQVVVGGDVHQDLTCRAHTGRRPELFPTVRGRLRNPNLPQQRSWGPIGCPGAYAKRAGALLPL